MSLTTPQLQQLLTRIKDDIRSNEQYATNMKRLSETFWNRSDINDDNTSESFKTLNNILTERRRITKELKRDAGISKALKEMIRK